MELVRNDPQSLLVLRCPRTRQVAGVRVDTHSQLVKDLSAGGEECGHGEKETEQVHLTWDVERRA